jgi:hypothetical protein
VSGRNAFILVLAGAFTAGGALAGEPGGTPDALYFSEAAVGGATAMAFFVSGYGVGGDPKENEGTGREKLSFAVYGAAPLASALSVFIFGEQTGVRTANRGECLLATTAVSYAATAAVAGLAYAATEEDKKSGAITASLYAALPVAFLNAAVYNKVKDPYFAPLPGYSLRIAPYMAIANAPSSSGKPLPVYGLELSF